MIYKGDCILSGTTDRIWIRELAWDDLIAGEPGHADWIVQYAPPFPCYRVMQKELKKSSDKFILTIDDLNRITSVKYPGK